MTNRWFLLLLISAAPAMAHDFASNPVINEEFNRKTLDDSIWTRTVGVNNNTAVFYTDGDKNISYEDGSLVLHIRQESIRNPQFGNSRAGYIQAIPGRDVSSASIATKDYFQYGRVEVVALVPESSGIQPAIWLQGKNRGQYGEIDIMESIGDKDPGARFATVHAGKSPTELERQSSHASIGSGFHTYTAEWTPDNIKIFYDDKEVLKVDSQFGADGGISPLNQPMQLKINIGGGSKWAGPIALDELPQSMLIKSIKVWPYLNK